MGAARTVGTQRQTHRRAYGLRKWVWLEKGHRLVQNGSAGACCADAARHWHRQCTMLPAASLIMASTRRSVSWLAAARPLLPLSLLPPPAADTGAEGGAEAGAGGLPAGPAASTAGPAAAAGAAAAPLAASAATAACCGLRGEVLSWVGWCGRLATWPCSSAAKGRRRMARGCSAAGATCPEGSSRAIRARRTVISPQHQPPMLRQDYPAEPAGLPSHSPAPAPTYTRTLHSPSSGIGDSARRFCPSRSPAACGDSMPWSGGKRAWGHMLRSRRVITEAAPLACGGLRKQMRGCKHAPPASAASFQTGHGTLPLLPASHVFQPGWAATATATTTADITTNA